MRSPSRRSRPLFAVAALAATTVVPLTPAPVLAQNTWSRISQRADASPSDRGWIGISFDVVADDWGRARKIIVAEVRPGSPAAEAGIRAGDELLAINDLDEAGELAELSRRLRIRPGDDVVLEVARRGAVHQIRLTAAPQPSDVHLGETVQVTIAPERVLGWARSMDSMRVEIERTRTRDVTVRATDRGPLSRSITIISGGSRGTVATPFEFHLFRGEGYDSLSEEMVELNRMMGDLELRLTERQTELERRLGSPDPTFVSQDGEVRRLATMLAEVSGRSAELESAMVEAALATAGSEYLSWSPSEQPRVTLRNAPAQRSGEFRPLSPYLIGRNRVAGAEVTDVKPELASYFAVEHGVLITDVTDGTPAATAGVVPGDVITEVGEMPISTVEELRFAISMSGDSIPLTVMRRGQERPITLRRR